MGATPWTPPPPPSPTLHPPPPLHPSHDAYTVRVSDRRVLALATVRPADARRWVTTTRWLHAGPHRRGRLVVGLGVQWTPPRHRLHGVPPIPATLQLCVGHRCLVFHLAQAGAVPEALRRFLADPRVTFVGSGSAKDRRMLWVHYGLHVTCGRELRAVAAMGNASMEQMAHRFLGYPGISKPMDVAISAWHAPRLSQDQVQYACVDAYLAFRLGLHLICPAGAAARQLDPDPAAPRAEWSPRALHGVAMLAVGADDAANSSSKVAETDYDGDVGDTPTHGLPVRAYASDSDDGDFSSDEFEHVGFFGAFTDEEEDEDDGYAGIQGDQEDEEGYKEYTGMGILAADNGWDGSQEFAGNAVTTASIEEEDGSGYQAFEYLGHCEAVLDDVEDTLARDDWYEYQEVEDEFEEFYLL